MEGSKPAIDLGRDIWHIISNLLSEDSPNSLLALRRTSRGHKSFVDPVLYRSLELSDHEERFNAAEHKIQRLPDPNDDLYLHVRHLIVSNTKRAYTNYGKLQKVGKDFRPGDLVAVIERLHRLHAF
ncbi:MAG: hypothetical protein Q9192_006479, partial [Flavoplaca navasiana]